MVENIVDDLTKMAESEVSYRDLVDQGHVGEDSEDDVLELISSLANKETFDPGIFETEAGIKVPIKPISPYFFDMLRSQMEPPEKPKYKVEAITGEVTWFEHDHESIKNASEEAKAEWEQWEKDVGDVNRKASELIQKLVLYRAVDLDPPEDEDWIEDQEFLGIVVPRKDKRELKIHYVKTEILGSAEDLKQLMTHVTVASGVARKSRSDIVNSFPDQVGGENPGSDRSTTGRNEPGRNGTVEIKRRLELQSDIP